MLSLEQGGEARSHETSNWRRKEASKKDGAGLQL